jgi:hypothetical protein
MGGNHSCPDGFQTAGFFQCQAKCPPLFRNVGNECIHLVRNRSIELTLLPPIISGEEIPTTYENERRRVIEETTKVIEEIKTTDSLLNNRDEHVRTYARIGNDEKMFKNSRMVSDELRKIKNTLKTKRPPTAPSSDLEQERQEIIQIGKQSLYFIQFALLLVVLVLLSYIVLPLTYANSISFLLLSVGVAIGFFLRT